METPATWFTTRQAAARLGLARKTLTNYCNIGYVAAELRQEARGPAYYINAVEVDRCGTLRRQGYPWPLIATLAPAPESV
jgi:hypothetical protein